MLAWRAGSSKAACNISRIAPGRTWCVLRCRLLSVVFYRRMRDDLQQLRDKTVELELKLDRVSGGPQGPGTAHMCDWVLHEGCRVLQQYRLACTHHRDITCWAQGVFTNVLWQKACMQCCCSCWGLQSTIPCLHPTSFHLSTGRCVPCCVCRR